MLGKIQLNHHEDLIMSWISLKGLIF